MKFTFSFLFVAALLIASCSKDKSDPNPNPESNNYINTTSGSTWDYNVADNTAATPALDYTVTSTSRDSSINGKSYHVYTSTTGSNEYRVLSGQDYYQFDSLPAALGVGAIERLYLKAGAPVGTTWEQSVSIPIPGSPIAVPIKISNEIKEIGISRMVNATNYTDVIHVSSSISSSLIPASALVTNIDSYYAQNYGLIENTIVVHLNYAGLVDDLDTHTKLTSAALK